MQRDVVGAHVKEVDGSICEKTHQGEGREAKGRKLIAAIALSNDQVLLTRNDREFLRVRGLRVETWPR